MNNNRCGRPHWGRTRALAVVIWGTCMAAIACADEPASGPTPVPPAAAADPWRIGMYYENDTRVRGKDASGQWDGLEKFRNTFQLEADKGLGDGWTFRSILRGTWDGVYVLNSDEYGSHAGGPIHLQNTAGPVLATLIPAGAPGNFGTLRNPTVPWGGGINNPVATAFGVPASNAFGFNILNNPNIGLQVLGSNWHSTNLGTVEFGVPVRPCDVDHRGCVDFGGYGDQSLAQLEFPEFDKHLDFIRELYVKDDLPLSNGQSLFFKIGRQQVVWGRTDLFRVLDVINPVDYSRNNIYDELQDIRIPMFIAEVEYRMGASEHLQDRNLQLMWNFDGFRPDDLGQCGTPNVILDAGCFFRGAKNLWDNGGTVSNFAPIPPGHPGVYAATDFGPHQIGIRNVYLPGWSFSNTQLGLKFEGVTQGGLAFSLNALTYRSQLPSLHAFNSGAVNPFTGGSGNTTPPAAGVPVNNLIAFDMYYPRVNLIGGSMDFQIDPIKTAVRVEGAYTHGEEFANTARTLLYSANPVFRSVIGLDRPTYINFINPLQTTLISAQIFYQHIFNHELYSGALGPIGMPDWKDDEIGTLLIKASYLNGRVTPQILVAYDVEARAFTIQPSFGWLISNHWNMTFGATAHGGDADRYSFDDCRSCNPYPPFTTYTGVGQSFVPGSVGLSGIEPLGRFRAGPIGAAMKQNEAFLTLHYKF